jgi:hypothetical protein
MKSANFRHSGVNHWLDEGLVHRKNRHEWNSSCRIALCEPLNIKHVTSKPHRIAIALCLLRPQKNGRLGADPDTAIYLEPLGCNSAALFLS